MRALPTLSIISMFLISCLNPPEKNEYVPFECSSMPEERTYFPEEAIVFKFNMNINPLTSEGFSAVSLTTGNILPFKIEKDTISLTPPLPANDTIEVTITSGLKSIDNRPLMTSGNFTEEKKDLTIQYLTGNSLPEVVSVLPEDSKSVSVAVKFSSPVEIKKNDVNPLPEKVISSGDWQVFIFKEPVQNVLIKKAKPADREELIENIEIRLPEKDPEKGELDISYEATDSSISIIISDDSAVAAVVNDIFSICSKKCTVVIGELQPSKKYAISIGVFTTAEVKLSDSFAFTGAPAPHIMISEIMHTPVGEP